MLNLSRDKYLKLYDLPNDVFSSANRRLRNGLVFVSESVRADSFSIAKKDNLQLMTEGQDSTDLNFSFFSLTSSQASGKLLKLCLTQFLHHLCKVQRTKQ